MATLPRLLAVALCLAAIAQFVLFGHVVWRTVIASPISDMFTYIQDYLGYRHGDVSLLGYLWQAHGEHRLAWIRLLTWIDVEYFHVGAIPFVIAATTAVAATAILIWRELVRAEPQLAGMTNLGLVVPMILLTAANATDCSVAINTTYPFTIVFAMTAFVLSARCDGNPADGQPQRATIRRYLGALVAAFAASLGTAAGLLAFPILLWMAWRGRLHWRWLAALALIGLAYGLVYIRGVVFLGAPGAEQMGVAAYASPAHLGKLAKYFLAFLGLPLTRDPGLRAVGLAFGGGMFVLGAVAVLVATFKHRLDSRIDRMAVGMILFSLGAALLATLGRGDMDAAVELPVRYTIFSTLLPSGLLCIALPRLVRKCDTPNRRIALSVAGLALAVVLLMLQIFIARAAIGISQAIARDAECFAAGKLTGPVSPTVSRWPSDAESVLVQLRRAGLLAPRGDRCAVAPGP
jgi:MFS family permease